MVRAKFLCIKKDDKGDSASIAMEPVVKTEDPEHENSKFFKYTPGGCIHLHCLNPAASAQFREGQEYYVDFIPVSAEHDGEE